MMKTFLTKNQENHINCLFINVYITIIKYNISIEIIVIFIKRKNEIINYLEDIIKLNLSVLLNKTFKQSDLHDAKYQNKRVSKKLFQF